MPWRSMRSTITPNASAFVEAESDDALIKRLQHGDRSALDALMRRHHQPLSRFVHHYLREPGAVDDIVQETFIRLYLKAQGFRFQSSPRSWLYQIAINLCKDHRRKHRQAQASVDMEEYDIESREPGVDEQIQHKRDLVRLSKQIDRLPEKLKTALILFAVEERSQEECASLLGITPKALELRVYRARKLLVDKISRV
jgi:RNA polymerase sigma factor (sigma-70 family)